MDSNRKMAFQLEHWLGKEYECECGNIHPIVLKEAVIDHDAYSQLAAYCERNGLKDLYMVCDQNTWNAAGKQLLEILEQSPVKCTPVYIYENERGEVVADEQTIIDLMVQVSARTDAVLAVGAGTLHDIVRFVTYKMGLRFLSVPTAPSVDGFVSTGAPIVLRGFKQTVPCHCPEGIFADPAVLSEAPAAMVAAGFGDMLGKFTSLADWKLGRLLQGEALCEKAEAMTRWAVQVCVSNRDAIRSRTPEGMKLLLEALIFSGISMLMAGSSRPASGGEHHLSHFWEMKGLLAGKKAVLHGAKVGVACLKTAELYERTAQLTAEEVQERLQTYSPLEPEEERAVIANVFGSIAPQLIRENGLASDTASSASSDAALLAGLQDKWEQIQAIAAEVPSSHEMKQWLLDMDGPVTTEELGLPQEWVDQALSNAHYIRKRYTILRLARSL